MRSCISCKRSSAALDAKNILFNFEGGEAICDSCVRKLDAHAKTIAPVNNPVEVPKISASQVLATLNKYVVSQDEAKKAVAVAVSQHLIRINTGVNYKSNLLLFGPSGSGKTEIARALKELNLPLIEFNCSSLSPTGYIGESASSMIEQLYYCAGGDINLTQNGIIFLDEFDKLAQGMGDKNEFKHKSIQQEFLKYVEGTEVTIKIDGGQKQVVIDTSKILFIAAGAFVGLENQFSDKKENVISIGMGPAQTPVAEINEKWQSKVTSENLMKYGLMPELVGRFPIISFVEKLTTKDFYQILTQAENSVIAQISNMAKAINIKLYFSDELLNLWSEKASKLATGARGVRGEIEKHTRDIFLLEEEYSGSSVYFDLGPDGKVMVSRREAPQLRLVQSA